MSLCKNIFLMSVLFVVTSTSYALWDLGGIFGVGGIPMLNFNVLNAGDVHASKGELTIIKKNIISIYDSFTSWLAEHKRVLLFAGLGGTYGYSQYALRRVALQLHDKYTWSLWRDVQYTLDELYAIQKDTVCVELIKDIQKKYMTCCLMNDFLKPISLFLVDIAQEEDYLQWYKKWYELSGKYYCRVLCFFDSSIVSSVDERLERLLYIKNIFMDWLSDYKLQSNNMQKDYLV
jgi:hypothetical protein